MTFTPKRIALVALWAAALAALLGFIWVRFAAPAMQETVADTFGHGDYQLVATDGSAFNEATLQGAPSGVFFGFTHCPEVCPTTLGDIAAWQEELGGADSPMRFYFVTVDPERDTVDMLDAYTSWVPGVLGVSGQREEIDKAIKAFRIFARKTPLENGGYNYDHSASVLLFDRNGRLFEPIGYQEGFDRAIAKMKRLIDS